MTRAHQMREQLNQVFRSANVEVEKYRAQTRNAGRRLGWDTAVLEWSGKHFDHWKQDQWQQAVDAALHPVNQAHDDRRFSVRDTSPRDGHTDFAGVR